LTAVAGLAVSFQAQAAFVTPAFRGEANTTYQQWNFFTTATDAEPDVGVSNPNGTPTLSSALGGILGSGNIYAFGAVDTITVDIPLADLAGYTTKVIVQTRTQGSEINYPTMNIGGISPTDSEELSRTPLGGFGGDLVDYYYEFDLPTNGSFTLSFNGIEHMSFDAIVIDTLAVEAVPEAGSLVMASLVAAGIGGVYLRRRKQTA
jgi:hypothetical protein